MKKPPSALRTRVLLSLGELVRYAIRIDSLRPSARSFGMTGESLVIRSKSKPKDACLLASLVAPASLTGTPVVATTQARRLL